MKSIKNKKGVIFLEYLLLLLMVLIAWQGVRAFGQSMGLAYQQAGWKMQKISDQILGAPVCNGNACFNYLGNNGAGSNPGPNSPGAIVEFSGKNGSFNFGNHLYAQGGLSGSAAGGAIGSLPSGGYIAGGQISGNVQAGGGQGYGAGGFGNISGTAFIPFD